MTAGIRSAAFTPNSKFTHRGISPIMAIVETARRMSAAGEDVISLSAGEPDFDTPAHVVEAGIKALRDGETKYTAVHGTAALREAIIRKFQRDQNADYALSEIAVGAGAKQILYNALMVSLDDGDEVITPTPCWSSYGEMVSIAGGRAIEIAATSDDNFMMDAAAFEAAITPCTRWLMINSPSNPTGAIYTRQRLEAIAEVLRRHPRILILSDEIYEFIAFAGTPFVSFIEAAPDLRNRTLVVNGVSKAYAMTGWRIGYGAGPAPLIAAMASLQSQSTTNPTSISQVAAIAALDGPQDAVVRQCAEYSRRRDLAVARLNAMPGVSCPVPGGAFYVFPSIRGVLGSTFAGGKIATDADLAAYLLDDAKVAIVPGGVFGAPDHLRISIATSYDQLAEALERVDVALRRLTPPAGRSVTGTDGHQQ